MIDDNVRTLAEGKNFGALTTLLPDGVPMTHVMWVDCDDDHVLVNTEVHRQKYKNIERDPRATITIWDADDPYRYVEVRGTVTDTVRGDAARAHIDELSRKYTDGDYANQIQSERVILKIRPERVNGRG